MAKSNKKNMFLKHFRDSRGVISYACEKTGISRRLYYNWIRDDNEFKEQVNDIEEETIDVVESKLLTAINDGDLTAIIFYLKTKGRNRGYVERKESDVTISAFEQLMRDVPDDDE